MEDKIRKFSISEALLIAIIPALFYIFAYAFERGYCTYFNLHPNLISINITNLLIVGGSIVGTLITLFLLFSTLPDRGTRVIFRTLAFPSFTGIFAWVIYKSDAHFLIKIPFIILFLVFLFDDLILPLFKYKGSWIDRWERKSDISDRNETPVVQNSIVGKKIRQLISEGLDAKWIIRTYWIVFVGLIISYYSGYLYGLNQKDFLVEFDKPNVLYLRRWSDHLVGMKFNSDKNELINEIYLIPINSDKSLTFINMRVDNLSPIDVIRPKKSIINYIDSLNVDSSSNKN